MISIRYWALALLVFSMPVCAAADAWVSQGPFGGSSDSIAIDAVSHAVYAGNFGGGVLKSTDLGLHWFPTNSGLGNGGERTVNALAASPAAGGSLVIGTQNGIWATTNGGATWSATNVVKAPTDVEGPDIRAVAFSKSAPSSAYAADNTAGGVWRSTDSGAHWILSSTGITDGSPVCLAVDPTSFSIVYVGTFGGNVFRSTDAGVTWNPASSGIPNVSVDSLLVDPAMPAIVLAGTGAGIYRSTNQGATWHSVPGPTVDTSSPDETTYCLTAGPAGPTQKLYAASFYGGIFVSTNDGATWSRFDLDLANEGPNAFAFDSSANVAYAALDAAPEGVARSTDGGVTWSAANSGYAAQDVPHLAIDPVSSDIVLAGSYGNGVFRSTDSGASWAQTSVGAFVTGLLFDRRIPAVAYFVGGNGLGAFKSTDSGQSWFAIDHGLDPSNELVQSLAESGSGGILLLGDSAGEIFRSTDGGATWTKSVAGLSGAGINDLAADPESAGTFFAGTDNSIMKSVDGGLHWAPSATGYPAGTPQGITVDPFNSIVVLAGSAFGGFFESVGAYRSTNGGASWKSIGGALAGQAIISFAADPAHAGIIYAASYGGGVFRSLDHGATWTTFSAAGLTNPLVVGLAVSSNGWVLEAGTDSTSTFRYEFTGRMLVDPTSGSGTIAVVPGHPR